MLLVFVKDAPIIFIKNSSLYYITLIPLVTLTWKDLVLPSTNEYKCAGGFRSKFYANQDILDLSFLNTRKFDDDSIWRLDFLARRLTLPAGKPRV